MDSKIFQDIPETQRETALEANCLKMEEKSIQKFFTDDEMLQMRADLSMNLIHIGKQDVILQKAKDAYKAATKAQYDQNEYLIQNLDLGFQDVQAQVYVFPDFESGMVGYYDNTGSLIESRRMTPEERQYRVPN